MATITAAQMHSETGYTTDDISVTNLEYLIDNAINYVNLEAGTSISNLSGSPGSVTVTANQSATVKPLIELLMRAYRDKGPNVAMSSASVAEVTSDPHYRVMMMMIKTGINRLRGRSFERV